MSGILGALSPDAFLRRHWQKKPLFLPGAFPAPDSLVTPDELAGLALEDDVESRLIFAKRARRRWVLKRGPFDEATLRGLPREGWSLLVQGLERILPQFAALLPLFQFIPGWRLDDLMVSLAPDGGSVGPHLDRYDVFLVQLMGERRWEISDAPLEDDFLDDVDLRILKNFKPTTTHLARPGDVLYLPPRFGHHGVARGMAMTLSVGFRSPRVQDVLESLAETLREADIFYEDADLRATQTPGLLDDKTLARVAALLKSAASDPRMLASAFGRVVTTPRRARQGPRRKWTTARLSLALKEGKTFAPALGLKLAFAPTATGMSLFVEGEEWDAQGVSSELLVRLGRVSPLDGKELKLLTRGKMEQALCLRLLNAGAFQFTR